MRDSTSFGSDESVRRSPSRKASSFVGSTASTEPVGVRWGRHRYRVPSLAGVAVTRSLEGSAAVFGVAAAAGFAGLLMLGTGVAAALPAALAAATAGTAVEAISPHGLDNLTVQLVAAGVAFLVL